MSTLKVNNLQVGQDGTPTNNYTLYQPASPDGTVRLGYGVAGSVTDILTLKNNGNVGIGQLSPSKKLETAGGAVSFSPDTAGKHTHEFTTNASNDGRYFIKSDTTVKVDIQANGASFFNGGNVGIGVSNPTQKLMVKGIIASEATNSTNNWMAYTYTDNTFRLNYNGAGRDEVLVTSDGKFGIGSTNPQATLQIGAGFSSSNPQQHGTLLISADDGLHNYIRFTNGGATETHYPSGIWYQPAGRMELRVASSASASNAAQLVLASNGNVGVGTDNPTSDGGTTFEIYDATTPTLKLNDGGDYKALLQLRGNDLEIRSSNGTIEFYNGAADGASSTERMRIASNGQVLIGNYNNTSAIHGNFEVNGNDGINISNATRTGSNGAQWRLIPHNGGGSATNLRLFEGAGATEVINVTKTGNIGVGQTDPNYLMVLNKATNTTSSYDTSSLLRIDGTGGANHLAGIGFGYSGSGGGTQRLPSVWMGVRVSSWTAYVKHEFVLATRGVDTNSEPTERLRVTEGGCLFLHDGAPSQALNSGTKLEVRGPAIGAGGVNSTWFKGFKIALDDATEWGGQAQFSVGRYEESGSNARSTLMISLGHGALNSSSNADVNVMEMRSNGSVMTPLQPAFQATGIPSHRYMNSWQGVALNNWNYIDVNTGSNFNNTNGRFTAPVPGKYFFIYTTMFQNPNTADFAIRLDKNGTMMVISNNHSGGGASNGHTWNDATVQAIIDLAAGDYVEAKASGSNSSTCYLYGSSSSRYGSFSGYLIG